MRRLQRRFMMSMRSQGLAGARPCAIKYVRYADFTFTYAVKCIRFADFTGLRLYADILLRAALE